MSTRHPEQGSAMVLALLVAFVLSLLGIAFLMLSETESRIAQNEARSTQMLYAAESGARLVKRWFDRPEEAAHFPAPTGWVFRSQRIVIDEDDPYGAPGQAANGGSVPYYKQAVDVDGNGADDLFRAPYRGTVEDSLMGTEAGPDILIDEANGADLLQQMSTTLFGEQASPTAAVSLRIANIEVYAPPYLETSGGWSRYGIGTVKVTARLFRGTQVLAEREVRTVLNEAPYAGPFGPLHSCGELTFTGAFGPRWGVVTADGAAEVSDPAALPISLPRSVPPVPWFDSLWPQDPDAFDEFNADVIDGESLPDPWLRLISGGPISGLAPGGDHQPYPPAPWPTDGSGLPEWPVGERSNVMRNLAAVTCPEYDYRTWKSLARSGGSDVHYYAWAGGTTFREDGMGDPLSFHEITNGRTGLFFFDTRDGEPPVDDDGDGIFENLTPEIVLGSAWSSRGVTYLNSARFKADGVDGIATTFTAPGEPYFDRNKNGLFDEGDAFVNLTYDTVSPYGGMTVSSGVGVHDDEGPPVAGLAAFHGILFTSGTFEATGQATYYGSVIARTGVVQEVSDGSADTPDLFFDAAILDDWPPAGWPLPRVIVTRVWTEAR